MRKLSATCLSFALSLGIVTAQIPQQPQKPQAETVPDDVVRISTELVQTDVVVTDKNDNIIGDLKLSDFEVYENGKKQDLKFMEFVSVEEGRRAEGVRLIGERSINELPPDAEVGGGLTARQLKRVVAFVVDDLTIPFDDMATVRKVLLDFVNNQMREGDLVAIVRSVGGKGLLQQFTAEKQLLRRAIAALNVSTNPFSAFNNTAPERFAARPQMLGATGAGVGEGGAGSEDATSFEDLGAQNLSDPDDESHRLIRGLISLSTANFVIDSLKEIPGRKSLVLISGGIPIFELSSSGAAYSNVTYLMNQLTNNAARAGVVINTMDPRGLKASPGVAGFNATPGRSALGAPDPNFGRGGSSAGRADVPGGDITTGGDDPFGPLLAGASERLGLSTVANATGGVSVVNTNDFKSGLDKVLARSTGYYLLGYTPAEKFNNKFRRIEVKVKRENVKVYAHRGYFAREEKGSNAPRTKEETILAAAKSPLAKRNLDLSANIVLKPAPTGNKTTVDAHLLIDANRLNFTRASDGKYQTSFDVVGFIYDQMGRLRGGFSETVATNLTPENYEVARKTGLTYSASTEFPPGYFQFRVAVRETGTGSVGTLSRYLEIPDLAKGRLAMSSIFLFAAKPAQNQAPPQPLLALRQISRRQDLRYAALIYNAKTESNKMQLRSQMIISQGSNVLYREPEQPISAASTSPATKIGQIGLSKVPPGHYLLTLVVTDPLADKKTQTVARSIDFTVID